MNIVLKISRPPSKRTCVVRHHRSGGEAHRKLARAPGSPGDYHARG